MQTAGKFNGKAEHYAAARPGYSMELIDCLYEKYGLSEAGVIADIGAGTGKFSKFLLERTPQVYCVEPNSEMRCAAEKALSKYPNCRIIAGDAAHTALPDGMADAITAAQAFHWFEGESFRRECLRIGKKGSRVFLIWNIREAESEENAAWSEVFSRFCPAFRGFSGGIFQDDGPIRAFFCGAYAYESFSYPLLFDRERFLRRSLSSSYSLKEGDSRYEAYLQALEEVFSRYARGGVFSSANRSAAYIGSLS